MSDALIFVGCPKMADPAQAALLATALNFISTLPEAQTI